MCHYLPVPSTGIQCDGSALGYCLNGPSSDDSTFTYIRPRIGARPPSMLRMTVGPMPPLAVRVPQDRQPPIDGCRYRATSAMAMPMTTANGGSSISPRNAPRPVNGMKDVAAWNRSNCGSSPASLRWS